MSKATTQRQQPPPGSRALSLALPETRHERSVRFRNLEKTLRENSSDCRELKRELGLPPSLIDELVKCHRGPKANFGESSTLTFVTLIFQTTASMR